MAKEIPKKLFFKIGEVCEITETQPYVLRFWESEFPQLAPKKNRSGQRIYSDDDIQVIQEIKHLLYEDGYTIAGARKRLEQDDDGLVEEVAVEAVEKEKGFVPSVQPVVAPPAAVVTDAKQAIVKELRRILALMEETDQKLDR